MSVMARSITIQDCRHMDAETFASRLRKAACCVYLACEESVADDLCALLTVAAERIGQARSE